MKIYTKTGDKGETGLIGGKRTLKSNPRIVAYGAVDELNSSVGVVIAFLRSNGSTEDQNRRNLFSDLIEVLVRIQNDLFIVGSDMADPSYPEESKYDTPRVLSKMASELEPIIDSFESELSPINFFILPGGGIESSLLHLSRSIARRAEVAVVILSQSESINPEIIVYLNRLSDLLFVAARVANKRIGSIDIAWHGQ